MVSIRRIRKVVHITIAIILLLVGLLGIVLPILNGVIPITIGLILLSFESPLVQRLLENLTKRNKHVHHWYEKLAHRIRNFLDK